MEMNEGGCQCRKYIVISPGNEVPKVCEFSKMKKLIVYEKKKEMTEREEEF